MRKSFSLVLVCLFVLSIAIGAFVSTAAAKGPIPCTTRCIGMDTYTCCLFIIEGEIVEECWFEHYGCE